MRGIFIFILVLSVTIAFAQTRRIAHRAHSGANSERYRDGDGSYGWDPSFEMVKIHLESGRDTMVYAWDSLAQPHYLNVDTTPRAQFYPRDNSPKEHIREMGNVTHRLIVKG